MPESLLEQVDIISRIFNVTWNFFVQKRYNVSMFYLNCVKQLIDAHPWSRCAILCHQDTTSDHIKEDN